VTAPTRATADGRAYLDLRKKARQDRRPVDELMQLYILECFPPVPVISVLLVMSPVVPPVLVLPLPVLS
jgi:hypothetical protein